MYSQKRKLIAAVSLCAAIAIPTLASAASISGQGTWESTLQGRDLDNNLSTFEAYYDTTLDITWLADANYADTAMTWTTANTWVAGLDFNGITGWRLPTTIDVGNNGCSYTNVFQGVDCGYNITTYSEMSHMYYVTLGDKAYYDTSGVGPQVGFGLTNTGPFSNVRSYTYWSATEYAPFAGNAWLFDFTNGYQGHLGKSNNTFAWAVHTGDVGASAVPVPAAVWLFGSGLLGLIGVARRKAA